MRGDADMKHRIARRLKSRAGESIAETLIGLLIASLALVMLAGAIATATRLVLTSKDKMDRYYEADGAMASHVSASARSSVTLTDADGTVNQTVPVEIYTNNVFANPVYAYTVKTGEGGLSVRADQVR